jgi:hypothetical protein
VQAVAHPAHEGIELAMDDSNASQTIRLGCRSLCGNALPFSSGTQVLGAELSDAAVAAMRQSVSVIPGTMSSSFPRCLVPVVTALVERDAILRFRLSQRIVEIAEGITEFAEQAGRRSPP